MPNSNNSSPSIARAGLYAAITGLAAVFVVDWLAAKPGASGLYIVVIMLALLSRRKPVILGTAIAALGLSVLAHLIQASDPAFPARHGIVDRLFAATAMVATAALGLVLFRHLDSYTGDHAILSRQAEPCTKVPNMLRTHL